MCKYCEDDEEEYFNIYKNDDEKYVLSIQSGYSFEIDEFIYTEIIIDYCPFCGRKL